MALRLKEVTEAGLWLFLAAAMAFTLFGCNDPNSMEMTLQALERGKARGQLVLTTDGRVSVNQEINFGIGAAGSRLGFSGNIDFSDKLKGGDDEAAGDPDADPG